MNGTILLENMEFYCFHGCHEKEQISGNNFLVDLELHTDCTIASASDNIDDALNYQIVYNLVRDEMKITSHLLEHVADRILNTLFANFKTLQKAKVKVTKLSPPLGGKVEKVSLIIEKNA